jgi:preprotein translocase subunit SecB
MKPSPIQLLRLTFKHVNVALDPAHIPSELPNPLEAVFTFDGVSVRTGVGIGEAEPQDNGRLYFLELNVVIDNVAQPEAANQKFSPYTIDMAAEGVVLIPKGAEKLGPPEDLAIVNGTGLLWSAIREQVLSLTARMRAGPVMLPTVHFHDLKKQKTQQPAEQAAESAAAPAAHEEKRPAPRRTR